MAPRTSLQFPFHQSYGGKRNAAHMQMRWSQKKQGVQKDNALSVVQETNKEMHSICRSTQPQDTHSRLRLYLADEVA